MGGASLGKAIAGAAVAGSLDHRLACRREREREIGAPYPPTLDQAKLSRCSQLPPKMHPPACPLCQSSIESVQTAYMGWTAQLDFI